VHPIKSAGRLNKATEYVEHARGVLIIFLSA
jgi:hypothetical protein